MPILQHSPFLLIPVEIRLIIYSYLIPQTLNSSPCRASPPTLDVGHENENPIDSPPPDGKPILKLRMLDPSVPSPISNNLSTLCRTKFFIRTGRFRERTMRTTYICTNLPKDLDTAILGVCKKTRAEAVSMLYATYTWEFDTHVEVVPAFFGDLTPHALQYVRRVSLVKRALAYDRSSDLCEWESATSTISTLLPGLRVLDLGVVAGKPASGWPDIPVWSKRDLDMMVSIVGWRGLGWVKDVAAIQVKQGGRVDVRAVMENCPDVRNSEMLGFWVGISRSVVEGGFGEWARGLIMAT